MKPLIGLSSYREPATWGVWSSAADLLPVSYTGSIARAGGIPVLLPPTGADAAEAVAGRLDGLVITGGPDVDPERYGAARHPKTQCPPADRDVWELALLDAAAAIGLPTLGICRGAQVMAVHAGGTLRQHLPDVVGHERHSGSGSQFGEVQVRVDPGSVLSALIGTDAVVSCHHHQAVDDHTGFSVTARSDEGVIEAIEQPGDRFYLGVQWHPEERQDAGLFTGLVTAAAGYAGRSGPAAPRS